MAFEGRDGSDLGRRILVSEVDLTEYQKHLLLLHTSKVCIHIPQRSSVQELSRRSLRFFSALLLPAAQSAQEVNAGKNKHH